MLLSRLILYVFEGLLATGCITATLLGDKQKSWFPSKRTLISNNWTSISSSYDGRQLVALSPSGRGIYVSSDFGYRSDSHIPLCYDGSTNIIVCNRRGWKLKFSQPADGEEESEETKWQAVAVSGDGMVAVALINGGKGFRSFNGGVTWALLYNINASNFNSLSDETKGWYSIASSYNGSRLVAAVGGSYHTGFIHTSTDSGSTWVFNIEAGFQNWWCVQYSIPHY